MIATLTKIQHHIGISGEQWLVTRPIGSNAEIRIALRPELLQLENRRLQHCNRILKALLLSVKSCERNSCIRVARPLLEERFDRFDSSADLHVLAIKLCVSLLEFFSARG